MEPKSSILMGFSLINHPFWGTPIYGNPILIGKPWNIDGRLLCPPKITKDSPWERPRTQWTGGEQHWKVDVPSSHV